MLFVNLITAVNKRSLFVVCQVFITAIFGLRYVGDPRGSVIPNIFYTVSIINV